LIGELPAIAHQQSALRSLEVVCAKTGLEHPGKLPE